MPTRQTQEDCYPDFMKKYGFICLINITAITLIGKISKKIYDNFFSKKLIFFFIIFLFRWTWKYTEPCGNSLCLLQVSDFMFMNLIELVESIYRTNFNYIFPNSWLDTLFKRKDDYFEIFLTAPFEIRA